MYNCISQKKDILEKDAEAYRYYMCLWHTTWLACGCKIIKTIYKKMII